VFPVEVSLEVAVKREAVDALARSPREASSLLDAVPALIFATGPEGVPTYVNGRLVEYVGRALDTLGWQGLVHPDDLDETARAWRTAAATGAPYRAKFRVRRFDGAYRWFEANADPLRDDQGRVTEFFGVLVDVDESARREEELRRSRQYLAEAQGLTHAGSWALSPVTNTLLYWSEECYRVNGFDPADGIPSIEASLNRIHPDDRAALVETMTRNLHEGTEFEVDYRLLLPDGRVRHAHVLAHPVHDSSGKLVEYIGTIMDVTEHRRAEAERKEHLWFLECMDRINLAMQRTNQLEEMMSGVVAEALAIFRCDRAWLAYPCDTQAATTRIVMEHTTPPFPSVVALNQELPLDGDVVNLFRRTLDAPGAVTEGLISPQMREVFQVQALAAVVVRPQGDKPYLFGLDHCAGPRAWAPAECRLLEEIGRRLEGVLANLLAHRNLLASQEELRRSERRFRTFVDHSTDAFYLYDDQARVLDVNRVACDSLGYTREELIGMRPEQFDVESTPEKTALGWERLRTVGHGVFPGRRRRKDGTTFPVEIRIKALHRDDRVYGIALVTDITERKRREQNLLAQCNVAQTLSDRASLEDAAPHILRAMSDALEWGFSALWRIDEGGEVIRCMQTWPPSSPGSSELAEATRHQSFPLDMGRPGKTWSSGTPICVIDGALDPRDILARSEGFNAAFAFPLIHNGEIVGVLEGLGREKREADPEFLRMMSAIGLQVGQFIERARAEDALRLSRERLAHASKIATVAELSASIAHEINQPLQAVLANGQACLRWLDAEPMNIENAKRTAGRVVRDANGAAEVVSRIRALFRHTAPAKTEVDINKLILQVCALVANELQGNGISLEESLADEDLVVRADAIQIQQVIVNLVRNAIEALATVEGRRRILSIRSRRDAASVIVDIADNGPGPADIQKIFEPFTTTKTTGMGMGLAICRSIIEAHAGRLRVERGNTHGVTFTFSLPVEGHAP
jgi:PAS domain S-box-containing protein